MSIIVKSKTMVKKVASGFEYDLYRLVNKLYLEHRVCMVVRRSLFRKLTCQFFSSVLIISSSLLSCRFLPLTTTTSLTNATSVCSVSRGVAC